MNKQVKMMGAFILGSTVLFAACGQSMEGEAKNVVEKKYEQKKNRVSGQKAMALLSSTNWQGTKVYDENGTDLTSENQNFIGLAKYEADTGRYEFFDAKTGESRNDAGTFFVTNDGKKRILISETLNYQAVVEMEKINQDIFTYKRMGKDKEGKDVEVYVEHIPYKGKELQFTKPDKTLDSKTGKILKNVDGDKILGNRLWNGTKVLDQNGNDVTEKNRNFISLAKYDSKTNKYEFFNLQTGESRMDFGYFDVLHDNKIRAHASIGANKYGAVLELTELNPTKFTYTRMGKNAAGNDIVVFVEHEPYKGKLNPKFSF
ncbi:DUF4822 domain-containing protein [Listeria fleischmannii]|uniref:DUF4822 domain-containing protein n=1 Tax=Listeria fleischmannii TaxID=1069827 RepID=A0A841YBW4_9LIST|nr:DUF4822 domain-containing protein [Listeria fleischmannii]MBC1397746.1 DUF4822 domain-containing protein [Listeria fleischmannii]MBC1426713.1 DUF4822 domain-containing protein [Listeria fleischmannii]STY33829.1 Uncharacterised protein [Listeria fleischmannii subsp. coloradonensis]